MTGQLISKDVLMITQHVGFFREEKTNKVAYELLNGVGMEPMIRSAKTGQVFRLSWHELLELAEARGIDDPNAEVET